MTVEQLLGSISSEELTEWLAFAQLEPWGWLERERHTALLAGVFSGNAPSDFIRDLEGEEELTPQEAAEAQRRFVQAMMRKGK